MTGETEKAVGIGTYISSSGEFERDQNYITTRITADGREGYPGGARAATGWSSSRACPWANRAVIVRRLLGLEEVISMGDRRTDA